MRRPAASEPPLKADIATASAPTWEACSPPAVPRSRTAMDYRPAPPHSRPPATPVVLAPPADRSPPGSAAAPQTDSLPRYPSRNCPCATAPPARERSAVLLVGSTPSTRAKVHSAARHFASSPHTPLACRPGSLARVTAAAHTPPAARGPPRPPRTPGGSSDSPGAPSAAPPRAASSHRGSPLSSGPPCLSIIGRKRTDYWHLVSWWY
jgi:hypothetical protein